MSEENITEFEFQPNRDAVVHIATELHALLSTESLGNYNGLDVLVALETVAAFIREQYGIVEMENESGDGEEDNDSEV